MFQPSCSLGLVMWVWAWSGTARVRARNKALAADRSSAMGLNSWLSGIAAGRGPGVVGQDTDKTKGPLTRPPCSVRTARSSGVAVAAGRLRRGSPVLRDVRVVQLVDRVGQVHIGSVDPALEPGTGREDGLGVTAILPDQPAQITQPVAGAEQPERPFAEEQIDPRRLSAWVDQVGEAGLGCARHVELVDEGDRVVSLERGLGL